MSMLLLISVVFLAYANGANDNAKGVATLLGSGRFEARTALRWAALTTALGAIVSVWFGSGLLAMFSGNGVVPHGMLSMSFSATVALGAAATVALATRFGFPVSTTHALVGALVGAGLIASPAGVHWTVVSRLIFLPLMLAPVLAVPLAVVVERATRGAGVASLASSSTPCVCAVPSPVLELAGGPAADGVLAGGLELRTGTLGSCGPGSVVILTPSRVRDAADLVVSGLIGFARGMNDSPKLAALALAALGSTSIGAVALVATAMACGGLVHGRRVGETMGRRIVPLTPRPALCANAVSAAIVLVASFVSIPVSTTHVSCGSIVGVGLGSRDVRGGVVRGIAAAWLITAPVAAMLAAAALMVARWA